MELFKNMKISTQLVTLTGILGALIVLTAVCCLYLLSSVSEEYQRVYDEDAYAATLATQAGKLFTESRNEYTRFLTRVDPSMRQESMTNMQKRDKELDVVFAELEKRAISAEAKRVMSDIRAQIDTFRSQRDALIKAQPAPGAPVETLPEAKRASETGYKLAQSFESVMEMGNKSTQEEFKKIKDEIDRAMLISVINIALVVILSMFFGMRLARNIGSRINRMADAAEVIGSGDLSQPMKPESNDEIGQAVAHFEHMRQNLNQSMNNIHVAAEQVAAGSRNVSEASVSLSQGAAEQASSVEELSASISEISSQTASNAENAGKANNLTIQARQQAAVGDADMKEMLAAMEDINTSSANISKIIKVIDEIAFQTNILALNAAVEAARAGQHGKGFAVVAEEVRNLAARSAKAAKETTELIEDSIAKVESGRAIAGKTAEALMIIMNNVSEVADIVSSIAKASSEQKLALEQIDQGVLQVSQVVQANSATSEEAASASEQLNAQAARLRETSDQFRLEPGGPRGMGNYNRPKPVVRPAASPAAPAAPLATKQAEPKAYTYTDDEEGFGKY
ncbi:methyl-accepting chemotaxis sensory transducer [Selenomonas ruminantium]|uniref:Methyl-accepting chemotaxis sensory transducer n=2 Tax=Selenomonas ruminantium TaxID=971 RepID=A0A1I3E8L6_SELRU|nr:methyl-accepting chemotaxis sensory transducer [Selenomonas ruminantium]